MCRDGRDRHRCVRIAGHPRGAAGDYNRNGVVDAADYTVWRDQLDATGLTPLAGADGDGDGEVTAADYGVWKSHFGQTLSSPGAGPVAVGSTRRGFSQETRGATGVPTPRYRNGAEAVASNVESVSLACQSN